MHGSPYGHSVEPPPSAATRPALAAPPPVPSDPEPETVAHVVAELSEAAAPPPSAAVSPEPPVQPAAAEVPAPELEDRLLMEFFSSPPPPPELAPEDEDDDYDVLRMSRSSKRAMWATLAIFGVSVVSIGGYAAYQQLVVPTPVELSGAGEAPVSALQPLAAPYAPPTAATETSISALRAAPPAPAETEAQARRYLLTNGAAQPVPGLVLDVPAESAAVSDGVAAPATGAEPGSPNSGLATPPAGAPQPGVPNNGVVVPAGTQPDAPAGVVVPNAGVAAPGADAQPAPDSSRGPSSSLAVPGGILRFTPTGGPAHGVVAPSVPQPVATNVALQPMAASLAVAVPGVGVGAGLADKADVAAVDPSTAAQLGAAARAAQDAPPPSAADDAPPPTFDELLAAAQDLARHDRHEPAFEAYQRALQLQPDSSLAMSGLAFTHLNLGDAAAAKLFASRAVGADPTNAEGWIVLGAAEDALGARDAAREAYRHCAEQGAGNYVSECKRLVR